MEPSSESQSTESDQGNVIVGLGVSPDEWIDAREILKSLRDQRRFATVVAWSRTTERIELAEQLADCGVIWLQPGQRKKPVPGSVYACIDTNALELQNERLIVVTLDADQQAAPIDHFFESLAKAKKELAVGVVLGGAGSDGSIGLRAISDAGGMTIALASENARQPSMPQAAVSMGIVDHVLMADQIAAELLNHADHMQDSNNGDQGSDLNRQILLAIPQIAALIEKHTDNDFKHYKTTTLARRIRRRIHVLKLPSVDAYLQMLAASRDEAIQLFRDLLIGVTAFFRDPDAFDSLSRNIVDKLVDQHSGDEPIRVWVAGCSTGQEAYSVAIAFNEAFIRANKPERFQIFATDIDERALAVARTGGYPIGLADEISPERLKRHFVKRGNRFFVSKAIRDAIVFTPHNLISDPPFTKVDLVSCRNLLIYLGSHLQKKLIPLFHYALKPTGYLFLGPAETLSVNRELFRNVDVKHRLYQRRTTALDRPASLDVPLVNLNRYSGTEDAPDNEVELFRYAQQIVLGEFSPQWCVVDDDGKILALSSDPSPFLKMASGAFKNSIIHMAHENLRIGLRAAFAEAKEHRRRALAEDMSVPVDGGIQRVHITVQPMPEMGHDNGLHLVAFHRIGTPLKVDDQGAVSETPPAGKVVDTTASRVIEQLELELSKTRVALEKTVQEVESSNEELKSSNEELLSMNEEMQTANEELETSKEELQVSNETLIRTNTDTQNLLRSTQIATIFLDNDLKIRGFTPAATQVYELVDSDIGRALATFVSKVQPMPELSDPKSLADDDVIEQTIGSRSGRTYIRRVIPYRGHAGDQDGIVVTFSDITELAQTHELVTTIAENSTQALIMMNADGYLTYCNQACLDMMGFDADEIRAKPLHDIIHHHYPDGRPYPMAECPIDRALPEDFSVRAHEDLFFRKDGSSFPVLCAASPIFANGVPVSTVIEVRDITEQKANEQELLDREAHLRRVINGTQSFLGVLDVEGRIIEVNAPALAIAGVEREQVVGQKFWETPWWSFDAELMATIREGILEVGAGNAMRRDLQYHAAGNEQRMVDFSLNPVLDDNGNVAYMVVSGVDITDRYEAERQMLETRDQLNAALSRLDIAMRAGNAAPWRWNPDVQELVADPILNRLFGFDEDAEVGMAQYLERIDADYREVVSNAVQEAINEGASYSQEYKVNLPSGEVRWLQARGQGVLDETGKPSDFFGFIVDVTDRHQFQETLEAARAAAEAANASKSTFLANMSHEIRTPMTAILGYIDLISESVHDDETRKHIRTVRRNGDFLLDIINDILDLSKIEAGKLDISAEVFSPDRLVEDVHSIMAVRAKEKGLEFSVQYKAKLPPLLLSDVKRIRQVLINLVGNAIKFTPQGSVRMVIDYTDNELHFDVVDTGIGMTDRQVKNLFQPFSQGDGNVNREFGGTGLGLAISLRLAEMLGGGITVESELARGSKFSVRIAAKQAEGQTEQNSAQIKRQANSNGPVKLDCEVLVVDDRRDIRFLSKTLLQQAGASVDEAEDGNIAIEMVEARLNQGDVYHLIMLDMQMPHRDGYSTARSLRQLGYAGPIIALTADAMQGDMSRCIDAGCNDYLSKPIDKNVMLQMVQQYVKLESSL